MAEDRHNSLGPTYFLNNPIHEILKCMGQQP